MGIMVLGLLIGILVLLVLHLRKKKKVRHIHSSSFDSPAVSLTSLLIDGDVFLEAFPVLARLPVFPPNNVIMMYFVTFVRYAMIVNKM